MKQHITGDQLNELSDKGNKELLKWEIKKRYAKQGIGLSPNHAGKYSLTSLSIGQMIELLDDKEVFGSFDRLSVNEFILNDGPNSIRGSEPCDILWEAVKNVLKK